MTTGHIAGRRMLRLGVLCLLIPLVLGSCQPATSWAPSERTLGCLIDVNAMPAGWELDLGPEPYDRTDRILPDRALEGMTVSYYYPEFGARSFHQILLYASEDKAAKYFETRAPFGTSNLVSPWRMEMPYDSLVADQMRLECADKEVSQPFKICVAWAQYGPYVSEFDTWVSSDYMSLDDLGQVLQAIDTKMASCMSRFTEAAQ